jgi:hypothetical protein
MEFEWKEAVDIPDGKHTGLITKITYRTEPYEYVDVWIKEDTSNVELKYGCPAGLSQKSKRGKLLMAFGVKPQTSEKIDPESIVRGRRASFLTQTKANKDGMEYAEIVADSVKPIDEPKIVDLSNL